MSITSERMRERRKYLGFTIGKVAELSGKHRSTISRYESGDIDKVPIDVLKPIAQSLKCSVDYLIGLSDDPDSKMSEIIIEFNNVTEDFNEKQMERLLSYARFLKSEGESK